MQGIRTFPEVQFISYWSESLNINKQMACVPKVSSPLATEDTQGNYYT